MTGQEGIHDMVWRAAAARALPRRHARGGATHAAHPLMALLGALLVACGANSTEVAYGGGDTGTPGSDGAGWTQDWTPPPPDDAGARGTDQTLPDGRAVGDSVPADGGQPDTTAPDAPAPADLPPADGPFVCDPAACVEPPAGVCLDANTLRRYVTPGSCGEDGCEYAYEDVPCSSGCLDAACRECGDGVRQPNEMCDGSDFGGLTCSRLDFDAGDLVCTADCQIDTAGCRRCGNGVREPGEACDNLNFGGVTCAELGYDGGDLRCTPACQVDTANCRQCGNGIRETSEACDGTDFGGQTCRDLGFQAGELRCGVDCRVDMSGCQRCGNGTRETGEACDGVDFGGATCWDFGFFGGTPTCTADCQVDSTTCNNCGNGIVESGEECDGQSLADHTCETLGFNRGGVLGCQAGCVFDTSRCNECEDGCTEMPPACAGPMASENDAGACDGLDNDCDGEVDEGCACTLGQVQPCFVGPPNGRNVGTCTDGTQTCQNKLWGPCVGGISPTVDRCDRVDNDCDGCTDDDLCCAPPIDCSFDVGNAEPFVDKVIDGRQIYIAGDATYWEWTLTRGPCDVVLNKTSFTMNGQATTQVAGASESQLRLNFQLSGSYTLTMRVHTPNAGILECSWVIRVIGPGMRIELCWDTTGSTDIDLHLGKIGRTSAWFATDASTADCFYGNCKNSYNNVSWGYPQTVDGYNPRLDIDNISTPGVPENINIDNPNEGDRFRVLVHFYSGSLTTHPVINVYCGGALRATYGVLPQVSSYDYGCGNNCGDGWKVVDVTWHGDYYSDTCGLEPISSGDQYVVVSGPYTWP